MIDQHYALKHNCTLCPKGRDSKYVATFVTVDLTIDNQCEATALTKSSKFI